MIHALYTLIITVATALLMTGNVADVLVEYNNIGQPEAISEEYNETSAQDIPTFQFVCWDKDIVLSGFKTKQRQTPKPFVTALIHSFLPLQHNEYPNNVGYIKYLPSVTEDLIVTSQNFRI